MTTTDNAGAIFADTMRQLFPDDLRARIAEATTDLEAALANLKPCVERANTLLVVAQGIEDEIRKSISDELGVDLTTFEAGDRAAHLLAAISGSRVLHGALSDLWELCDPDSGLT